MLRGSVQLVLSEAEMEVYRQPYLKPEHRHPMLTWPRELTVDGVPEHVTPIVESYGAWLKTSDITILFINAEPGSKPVGPQRAFCLTWSNQQEVTVSGMHFFQKDCPHEI